MGCHHQWIIIGKYNIKCLNCRKVEFVYEGLKPRKIACSYCGKHKPTVKGLCSICKRGLDNLNSDGICPLSRRERINRRRKKHGLPGT